MSDVRCGRCQAPTSEDALWYAYLTINQPSTYRYMKESPGMRVCWECVTALVADFEQGAEHNRMAVGK